MAFSPENKISLVLLILFLAGCASTGNRSLFQSDVETLIDRSQERYVVALNQKISIFENVAFGLGIPLRHYLNSSNVVQGKTILDLGTGAGVLSLIALNRGARLAVATDINPYAVENARYNAQKFGYENKMDVRLVSMDNQGAYSVVKSEEKFDFIVSNPPQGRKEPETIYDFSHTDPELAFLRSILEGLQNHLAPNGKGVFALYNRGLALAKHIAAEQGLTLTIYLKTWNKNGAYNIVEIERK